MTEKVELILQHGWAFDAGIWAPMLDQIQAEFGDNVDVHLLDRGYFGNPSTNSVNTQGKTVIVICHSFGLHLLPKEILSRVDLLVILSGFMQFHSLRDSTHGSRSRKNMSRMISKLKEAPYTVLSDFHGRCGATKRLASGSWISDAIGYETNLPSINQDLLVEDLELLDVSNFAVDSISPSTEIVIVHGDKDPIVPFDRAELIRAAFKGSRLILLKDAEHSIPITHVADCAEPVLEFLRRKLRSTASLA